MHYRVNTNKQTKTATDNNKQYNNNFNQKKTLECLAAEQHTEYTIINNARKQRQQ